MLSRKQAQDDEQLQVDIASPDVIAQTPAEWQDYVRLYFRPRTPTQYRNEGFRPIGQWQLDAHCPVPIYFLFNSIAVLSRGDSLFAEGNVGRGAIPIGKIDHLESIPFEKVYHDTWFDNTDVEITREIVYHRHAEVLVPQRLGIGDLRLICCRSQAEYETLIHLLPPGTLARWVDKIGVRPNLRLFHNRWTFVKEADMSAERVLFKFNKGTATPGPFGAHVQITELPTGLSYSWSRTEFFAADTLDLSLYSVKNPEDYSVHLTLDGQLVFASRYQEEDLPF